MIELLLAAEGMLAAGDLDHAERLFSQVAEADPRNAIAVVGLAEVAAARADPVAAAAHARRALEIDPENAAARRMVERLEAGVTAAAEVEAVPAPEAVQEHQTVPEPEAVPAPPEPEAKPEPPRARPSWLHRLLGFLRHR